MPCLPESPDPRAPGGPLRPVPGRPAAGSGRPRSGGKRGPEIRALLEAALARIARYRL